MKGYPNILNSKEDYYYVKENFPKELWGKDWQALLDSKDDWFFDHYLAKGEIGITDDTHKVEIEMGMMGEENKSVQYVLKENPTCKLYRLGFTVEEVEKAIR